MQGAGGWVPKSKWLFSTTQLISDERQQIELGCTYFRIISYEDGFLCMRKVLGESLFVLKANYIVYN